MISKRGDLTIAYGIDLPEVFAMGSEAYNQIHQGFIHLFRRLEPGTLIHQQSVFFRPYEPVYAKKGCTQKANQAYYLDRPLIGHQSYLFITLPMQAARSKHPAHTLFSRLAHLVLANPLAGIERLGAKAARDLASRAQRHRGGRASRLNNAQLQEVLYRYFSLHFQRPPSFSIPPPQKPSN